jgi:hypothetical protein
MSRGFDEFEIDDFRGSDSYSGRDFGGASSSNWEKAAGLHRIHQRENQADFLDREGRGSTGKERPAMPRVDRVRGILAQRLRTKFVDRDKEYSLRESEVHALTEVGKFRVVGVEDLAEFAYAGDRSRLESDFGNLIRQRLDERRGTSVLEKESREVIILTKRGQRLIRP